MATFQKMVGQLTPQYKLPKYSELLKKHRIANISIKSALLYSTVKVQASSIMKKPQDTQDRRLVWLENLWMV